MPKWWNKYLNLLLGCILAKESRYKSLKSIQTQMPLLRPFLHSVPWIYSNYIAKFTLHSCVVLWMVNEMKHCHYVLPPRMENLGTVCNTQVAKCHTIQKVSYWLLALDMKPHWHHPGLEVYSGMWATNEAENRHTVSTVRWCKEETCALTLASYDLCAYSIGY